MLVITIQINGLPNRTSRIGGSVLRGSVVCSGTIVCIVFEFIVGIRRWTAAASVPKETQCPGPVEPEASKVMVPLLQSNWVVAEVIFGVGWVKFSEMVMEASAEQPLNKSVSVTLYVPAMVTVRVKVVSPVDHTYSPNPGAFEPTNCFQQNIRRITIYLSIRSSDQRIRRRYALRNRNVFYCCAAIGRIRNGH